MNDTAGMRFGLFGGPAAGLSNTLVDDAYEDYVNYVVAAEEYGFYSVFLTEHHFTGLGQASSPLTLLAHLAAKTSRIRLGTGVTVLPWYNPLIVAEQAATVDVLSKGRLDFGVGRGFRESEFAGFGQSLDDATQRYEEALGVILRAWTADERWSHQGEVWRFENVVVEPEPVQTPRPPVWVGAGSEPSIVRAADNGFNVLLDQIGSFEKTGERVAMYSDRVAELGRSFSPYDVAVTRSIHIVDGPAERKRAIEARGAMMSKLAALANAGGTPKTAMAAAFSSDIEQATENGSIIGDVDECVERIERLHAEGVEYVLLVDPDSSLEMLEIFANEIMPRVRPRLALAGE
jgi:alkanesulfonate monooxygenase SsuD/methylene tetrahydromethanopterin reductase-like flavin-dependent oxidoreductase (luciferase family)